MPNKLGPVVLVVLSGWCALQIQACSSYAHSCAESYTCAPKPPEAAAGAADDGTAGEGGEGGQEPAGDAGAAGAPETDPRPGIASDSRSWLIYDADDDTPGRAQLYAAKQTPLGLQLPIKISAPLPAAESVTLDFAWSADGQWFLFGTTQKNDRVPTRWYAVSFAGGAPHAPVVLSDGLPGLSYLDWSPTGHELLLQSNDGNAYWTHLSEQDAAAPIRLNSPSQVISHAIWATSAAVLYGTKDAAAYRVVLGPDRASSPIEFRSSDVKGQISPRLTSRDRKWALFVDDVGWLLAQVDTGTLARLDDRALDQDQVSVRFSPDSRYLEFAANDKALDQSELYLLDLLDPGLPRITVASGQALPTNELHGGWSANASFLTYFSDTAKGSASLKSVHAFDLLSKQSVDAHGAMNTTDDAFVAASPDGAYVLYSYRASTTKTRLLGVDRAGEWIEYDENAAGTPYSDAEFSADGSLALFCTTNSAEQTRDMSFADLRGSSVRVPGDGSVSDCSGAFAPDSKGFVYFRVAADGAQTLNWVDTTQQVMGKPRQINRDGRVRSFRWQPRSRSAN